MLSTFVLDLSLRRSAWLTALAVGLLLALHTWMAMSASLGKSTTADEVAHLTAGHSYWAHNDYRLQPENGNLPQRWEGLPALFFGWHLPDSSHPGWRNGDVWAVGDSYFHHQENPLDRMLFWGRLMNEFWSVATGLLVFVLSKRLFGRAGAFVSLLFFVFCPSFLAHGALATSDMCMVFFFLACTAAFWRQLHDTRPETILLSSLLFGLACVAKFSAVLLFPIFAILIVCRVFGTEPMTWNDKALRTRTTRLVCLAGSGVTHVMMALLVIWGFFGFRHEGTSDSMPALSSYYRSWPMIRESLGGLGDFLWQISQWHLLPDAFVYGFAHVVSLAEKRGAFLNGEYSLTGWVSFFPYTFLVKSTLAFLLACGLSLVLAVRKMAAKTNALPLRRRLFEQAYDFLPLFALFAVYWASSLTSNLNIGHRHILPTYPVLFICLGALGPWALRQGRLALACVVLLLAGHVAASVAIRPHYLASFNSLSGGPREGYRHLVDSSLDWGQDLPSLKTWIDAERARLPQQRIYLSYFGTGSPAYYKIEALGLPWIPRNQGLEIWAGLHEGVYCISATMLQHVYNPVFCPWTLPLEKEYQELRQLEPAMYAFAKSLNTRDPANPGTDDAKWKKAWDRFNLLRFARLCHYLRVRGPDEEIGYSILVFRLSEKEVADATAGSWSSWQAAIEKVVH